MTLHPGFIRGGVGPLGAAAKGAEPWWLAGGISASACVAAYQPKGAASYAESLKNINNPGTNDAYEGTAPSWSAGGGWSNAGGSGYLWGANVLAVQSVIVRYGEIVNLAGANQSILGQYRIAGFYIGEQDSKYFWINCSTAKASGAFNFSGGVLAISGSKTYVNGAVDLIDLPVGSRVNQRSTLMATDNWGVQYRMNGAFIAAAYYNSTLTDAQIATLTTAMNAL